MSVQVEQISAFQKRLQFSIPGTEVQKKLDDAFRNLGNRVNIPGFRRGHVPRSLLEARWGKQLRAEVAADLINWKFREASVDLEFIGQPEVEKNEFQPGKDFNFSVVVQVKPAVEANDYVGIGVEWPEVNVADDRIEAEVQRRLSGHARMVEVTEDRPVERGDFVLTEIHEVGESGETLLEAGTMVNTGAEKYYPGVEELLVGKKKGEEASGPFAAGGRSVTGRVKVLDIQVSRAPELTDELAAELGYEGGTEGMRAAIRMQEEQKANDNARNLARVDLLRKLIVRNPLTPPPAMVESHLQLLMEELKIQQSYRGRDPRSVRFSEAQIADLRERAGFSARSALLLESVAKKEGLEVTDADLDAKYQEIADMRGQRVEAIRGYFAKDNAIDELRRRISEERTLDWLLERAEVNAAAPAAEAKPAKKAASKKKAEAAPPAPVEEAPVAEVVAEAKPAKKAAPKKKAEAVAAPPAEEPAAVEEKPKKKPAKKKE